MSNFQTYLTSSSCELVPRLLSFLRERRAKYPSGKSSQLFCYDFRRDNIAQFSFAITRNHYSFLVFMPPLSTGRIFELF
uniref:Uncharacterized protein n=1 Tax=Strigamia maritima TaxID=126957 RepID=T1JPI0_STRMM